MVGNAAVVDPETGRRVALRAGQECPEHLVPLVDPKALGRSAAAVAPPEFRGVALEDLLQYAQDRGVDVPEGADGHGVLAALSAADAELATASSAATQGDGSTSAAPTSEPTDPAAVPDPAAPTAEEPPPGQESFDVDELLERTVDEVNAYLDEYPQHAQAVLAAEAQGKARKGITEGPHAQGSPS